MTDHNAAPLAWQAPEAYGKASDKRGLSLHWLTKIEGRLTPTQQSVFRHHLDQVFAIERSSRTISSPTMERLEHTTATKGAHSVLLFRSLLEPPLSEAEAQALWQFGALLQLCDDVFDVWFDHQAGIPTLPLFWLKKNELETLNTFFEQKIRETQSAFFHLKISKSRVAWAEVHFIANITRVCLQHYRELAKKHGTLPFDSRKDMVVDMASWKNRLSAILYFIRQP